MVLSDTAGTCWGPGVEGATSLTRAREAGPGSAAPPSGGKQRQGGMGCREARPGGALREQQSVKGKRRLVLCKLKYRDTRIARVVYREKL